MAIFRIDKFRSALLTSILIKQRESKLFSCVQQACPIADTSIRRQHIIPVFITGYKYVGSYWKATFSFDPSAFNIMKPRLKFHKKGLIIKLI